MLPQIKWLICVILFVSNNAIICAKHDVRLWDSYSLEVTRTTMHVELRLLIYENEAGHNARLIINWLCHEELRRTGRMSCYMSFICVSGESRAYTKPNGRPLVTLNPRWAARFDRAPYRSNENIVVQLSLERTSGFRLTNKDLLQCSL